MRTHRYIGSLIGVAIGLATLVACGGGTTSAVKVTPANAALSTSAPLSSTALAQQPVATAVPAPPGYTQSVSAALVTTGANTSVSIKEGTSNPSGVPVLSIASKPGGVQTMSKDRPMTTGQPTAVFYDVITPSAAVTVAGTVSFTQTFPAGSLASGTNYYLAFYDSTQASPTWQTISGPVTTSDDLTLTFSGNVPSFTFQQGQAYGFCVFSVTGSSTPPPSQNQTVAYLSQGAAGILVYTTAGTLQQTINISSAEVGLDDGGNLYNNLIPPTPSPSGTNPPSVVQKFPAGSTTASATFASTAATDPNNLGFCGLAVCFLSTSGSGEVAAGYFTTNTDNLGFENITLNVWNSGSTGGPPNYSITQDQGANFTYDVQHDGTIYFSQSTPLAATPVVSYLVYPPGSSTPSRTVPETIVTGTNAQFFSPNYMTVGPDGTIYVTEYSLNEFGVLDPYCGLYVFPPSGSEKLVTLDSDANGCGAFGVDIDATGNIYVAVNNTGLNPSTGMFQAGTINEIEVFSPGGASVLRRINVANPIALVAAPDGTLFVSSFPVAAGIGGVNATFVVPAGSTTATQITSQAETAIVLYNGYQESATSLRRHTSVSGAVQAIRSGPAAFAKFLKMGHRGHNL